MKRCLTSGKCKSESQWAVTSHWSRMTILKKTTNDKNWWGCGEEGTLCTVGGNVNCCRHCGKQYVVQSLSCLTFFNPMDCSMPGFLVLYHLAELAQTHVHLADDAIQPCHPLSPLLLLSSIFPSVRVFSNESALHIRWPEYWSFSINISPCNEYSGLISINTGWFDLLAVQGTLRSLLQHHGSKASILWCSTFFMVQLSWAYMTSGKTKTIWTSVNKVMSLIFNTLSRFVITSLSRIKHLLISWL